MAPYGKLFRGTYRIWSLKNKGRFSFSFIQPVLVISYLYLLIERLFIKDFTCNRPALQLSELLYKIAVVENYSKIQSIFLNEIVEILLASLLIKKYRHRCFSVDFKKFLQNTNGRLFLCYLLHLFKMVTISTIKVHFPVIKTSTSWLSVHFK